MAAFCLFAKVPFVNSQAQSLCHLQNSSLMQKSKSPGLLLTKVKPQATSPAAKNGEGEHVFSLTHSRHAFRIVVFLGNMVDDL